jgi:hypothetical protein
MITLKKNAVLCSVLAALVWGAASPALAWEPVPNVGDGHAGVARVLDLKIYTGNLYVAVTGEPGVYIGSLGLVNNAAFLGPEWLEVGPAHAGLIQSIQSMLMWARTQNLPVRLDFMASLNTYQFLGVTTCTDAAACEPGPAVESP